MQGSVSLCLTVLFSSGDLEVSNSAIQIHCARYILSFQSSYMSSPPHLLLTFSLPPPVSSRLLSIPGSRLCLFFSRLILFVPFSHSPPIVPLSPDHISPSSCVLLACFFFVILPFPFPSSSSLQHFSPRYSPSFPHPCLSTCLNTLPFLLLLSLHPPLSNLLPFSNPCCLPIFSLYTLSSFCLLPRPPSPRLPTNSPYRLLQNPPEPFPPSSQHIAADTSQSFLRFIAALFRAHLTISCRADSHTLLGNMSPCCWIQNISFYEFIKTWNTRQAGGLFLLCSLPPWETFAFLFLDEN